MRSNIAFTSDWLTDEEIWDAARKAQLEEVIEALLDAGADPRAGTPSAVETAQMFDRGDLVSRFES